MNWKVGELIKALQRFEPDVVVYIDGKFTKDFALRKDRFIGEPES